MQPKPIKLRRLVLNDLSQIIEIEYSSFPQPWTMENFLSEFERNFTLAIGLSQDKLLLAYSFSWLLPPETHLLNLAVHPDFRGQGLGRRLLGSILRLSRKAQCRKVFLEVREGNQAAMGLYASLGFLPTSRRPSYYSDGSDAILMTLDF